MEERGCEGGQEEYTQKPIVLRVATYNILNTKGKQKH